MLLRRGGDTMVVETRCSVHYKHLIIIRNEKDFSIFLVPRFHRLFRERSSKSQKQIQLNVILHEEISPSTGKRHLVYTHNIYITTTLQHNFRESLLAYVSLYLILLWIRHFLELWHKITWKVLCECKNEEYVGG